MLKKFRRSKKDKTSDDSTRPVDALERNPSVGGVSTTSSFGNYQTARKPSYGDSTAASATLPSRLSPGSSYRGRSPSPSTKPKPTLGLHIVHQPARDAPLDIIFVHGLGGDSRKTWSKNHDPGLFWPELWLPFDPDIGKARIMSFGYNADFKAGTPRSIANVGDFAKELLYEMKFARDDAGGDIRIGRVPIIFIVHSMGGLVVKKAYILGQNDEEYQQIIRSISAIMFMATPHRGTNLAEILNRILNVSFQSPKSFISELNKSSPALEDLNEQFRHIAPKLSIISFYETLTTNVGPKKLMVLDKDSSILGYPKEVSRALNADHHDVVKYSSPDDSNYVSVRNALKTLVGRFRTKGAYTINHERSRDSKCIENLLGVSSGPDNDFKNFRRRWMPSTCEWLLEDPSIQSWLDESPGSKIVWYSAPPASGKSILATHVISYLRDMGSPCGYFFFRFGDQSKRSISMLLRSIAYQLARQINPFQQGLLELVDEGLKLDKTESSLIWQKIFESILYDLDLAGPVYIVIDGLDESERPNSLVEMLATIEESHVAIRILVLSRRTESLFLAFERLSSTVTVNFIGKEGHDHNLEDIRTLVEKETKHMRGSDQLKSQVQKRIIERAGGNFLWVRLVLEEILGCHSEEAIQETLEEIPDDMSKLYQRMELSILNSPRKSNKRLAKVLLQWTICAHRPLSLKELSQALVPDFPEFLDLRRTIQDVCGQFVLVDDAGQVSMIHQTARDHLIQTASKEIAIDLRRGHSEILTRTISALLDPSLRSRLTHGESALQQTEPFLFYAATSWTYHLRHAGGSPDVELDILVKLFSGQSVLVWIHCLALVGRLEVLVKAAKTLTHTLRAYRRHIAAKNPLLHRLSDLELLDQWIVDLVKVVGKFSRHLLFDPSAIYKLVAPLCPEKSVFRKQFYRPVASDLTISGISNAVWSDHLARINVPNSDQAWNVLCAGQYIAVLGSAGNVSMWNSNNFAEVCTLCHEGPVTALSFSTKGSRIVTYGLRDSKLWSVPTGQLISTTPNPPDSKAMAIAFTDNDAKIIVGGDDKIIRYLKTDEFDKGWQTINPALLKEPAIEGAIANSPMHIAFNGDLSHVGVAYRGFPLSIWALNEGKCINRCKRTAQFRKDGTRTSTAWFGVDRFTFNPVSGHVIGIYKDGCIFKWHPLTDENQEVMSAADEVAASPDGKLFITSNSNGTVKVWNFAYFSVIYQLSSSDLVTGLTFSPDCTRFYDVRGPSVNAWEPNSLIRFSENEESFSDSASEDHSLTSASQISEALVIQYEDTSAIAHRRDSFLYCFGDEEGVVKLGNACTGEVVELQRFMNFLSVSHLAWSSAGHVAATDLGGDVMVSFIPPEAESGLLQPSIKPLPSPTPNFGGHGIHQILFNTDASLLLLVSEKSCQVWKVEDATLQGCKDIESASGRQWINHPQESLFMGCGVHNIKAFQWSDLAEIAEREYREYRPRIDSFDYHDDHGLLRSLSPLPSKSDVLSSTVIKAIISQDEKHLLVQIKDLSTQGNITKRVILFDNSAFDMNEGTQILTSLYLPPSIIAKVDFPMGILRGSRLVFLDQDLWICSYRLSLTVNEDSIIRHYFIPRDWASTESLGHACMMYDGTFLCPKDDKVAVIKSNLESGEF